MTRESVTLVTAKARREGTLALIRPVTTSTRRSLRGEHQVDAAGPGELRDAHDRVLDVARGDHHEVGELVDDDQQVRVRLEHALAADRQLDLAGDDGPVEVVDVTVAERREVVVAHVHLLHDPLQRLGGLLGVRDDGRDQVRHAGVGGELDALRVDQHHAHVGRACARMSRLVIIEFTKLDLPEPVEPATRRWGIFARFATT